MVKKSCKSSDNLNERTACSDKLVEANATYASDSSPIGEDRRPASATSPEVATITFYDAISGETIEVHPILFDEDTNTFKSFRNKKPSDFNSSFRTERSRIL